VICRLGRPEKTVFVGDSNLDIECGKRAKCKYLISVLSDISNYKFLEKNSDQIIKNFLKIRFTTMT
jgi:phosphoglycolate phosphatase-like HAD superfamily hydrolase